MLSDILRSLVAKKGLTQKAIAQELNISQQRFNFYVNGTREPDIATLILLSDYFGVTLDYLVGHEKKPTVKDDGLETYEKKLLDTYRMASPEDRAIIDNIVRRYTHAQTTAEKHA